MILSVGNILDNYGVDVLIDGEVYELPFNING